MTRFLFPDNSVVVSFACADELRVLKAYLNGSGRVVEAVAREITDSTAMTPNLSTLDVEEWFGTPIPINRKRDVLRVEGIRVAVFGGTKAKPRQHLGESQTLHLLKDEAEFRDSTWLTEDRDAFDFANRQHITTRDIHGILCDLVGFGEITADRAYEVAQHILDAGRGLLQPPTSASDYAP